MHAPSTHTHTHTHTHNIHTDNDDVAGYDARARVAANKSTNIGSRARRTLNLISGSARSPARSQQYFRPIAVRQAGYLVSLARALSCRQRLGPYTRTDRRSRLTSSCREQQTSPPPLRRPSEVDAWSVPPSVPKYQQIVASLIKAAPGWSQPPRAAETATHFLLSLAPRSLTAIASY